MISSISMLGSPYADRTTACAGAAGTSTLSNATPQEMKAARVDLDSQGKLTFKQNGEMMIMDGEVLASANGGRQVTGSSNLYKIADESVAEQKSYGSAFNGQVNVASYTSLQFILEQYDQSKKSGVSAVT